MGARARLGDPALHPQPGCGLELFREPGAVRSGRPDGAGRHAGGRGPARRRRRLPRARQPGRDVRAERLLHQPSDALAGAGRARDDLANLRRVQQGHRRVGQAARRGLLLAVRSADGLSAELQSAEAGDRDGAAGQHQSGQLHGRHEPAAVRQLVRAADEPRARRLSCRQSVAVPGERDWHLHPDRAVAPLAGGRQPVLRLGSRRLGLPDPRPGRVASIGRPGRTVRRAHRLEGRLHPRPEQAHPAGVGLLGRADPTRAAWARRAELRVADRGARQPGMPVAEPDVHGSARRADQRRRRQPQLQPRGRQQPGAGQLVDDPAAAPADERHDGSELRTRR